MNRSQAKQLGLREYETGLPCRNGHLSKRYTQSGTCAACINASKKSLVPASLSRLVQFRVRVFLADFDFFLAICHASALEHEPLVRLSDIWRGNRGQAATRATGLYIFRCFPEDETILTETALRLFNERAK